MSNYIGSETPYDSPTFGKSLSLKVEGGFNAVSINPSGRDVVLAGRLGLYIIDLDDPFSPPRWLHHTTPWQVADVQWSPHPAKPQWVVSTSNQKALIWNLELPSTNAIEHVLHGHTRAISDINFNRQHPDLLATCSVDTYVHAWDMRSPKRPFFTASSWESGASQVKWNFRDPNVLASSHANEAYIWDLRNGSTPLCRIRGHISSLNSIDFNRSRSTELMTSSNDGTIKFWDYSRDFANSMRTITTDFPVWRGRYLPFGEGCCIMPTVDGNNSLYLTSLVNIDQENNETDNKGNSKLQPIYVFKGHSKRVIDFLWRSRCTHDSNGDDREFQLVTWSQDCDLRLWPVPDQVYEKTGFDRYTEIKEKPAVYPYVTYNREFSRVKNDFNDKFKKVKETLITSSGLRNNNNVNHITWLSGIRMDQSGSTEDLFEERGIQNLGEEVSAVGHKFPKIIFEKISVSTQELIVTLNGPWVESDEDDYIFLRIDIKFPKGYPSKGNIPHFDIEENVRLKPHIKEEMMENLTQISKKYTDVDLYCLEPCLRYLLGETINLDDIEIEQEPIFNFDIVGRGELDDASSLASSKLGSQPTTDSSYDSDQNILDNLYGAIGDQQMTSKLSLDMNLESTPIPNDCGCVWSATGQLVCFFTTENKEERKLGSIFKAAQKDTSKGGDEIQLYGDSDIKSLRSDYRAKKKSDSYSKSITKRDSDVSSNYESSDDSYDSIADDWDDMLRNDIVVRTKLPRLKANFNRALDLFPSESGNNTNTDKATKTVVISEDFSYLVPDKKELALEYKLFDVSLEEVARHNSLVAQNHQLFDVYKCWQMLSDIFIEYEGKTTSSLNCDRHLDSVQWYFKESIAYFQRHTNLQMVAMLCTILLNLARPSTLDISKRKGFEGSLPIVKHLITFKNSETQIFLRGDNASMNSVTRKHTPNYLDYRSKSRRSLSQSTDGVSVASGDYFSTIHNVRLEHLKTQYPKKNNKDEISGSYHLPSIEIEMIDDEVLNSVFEPFKLSLSYKELEQYRCYIRHYTELLYRWGVQIERVEILKATTEPFVDIESATTKAISKGVTAVWLPNKARTSGFQSCNYCGLRIERNVFICGNCQHVLHGTCAKRWWRYEIECPTGCGCHCSNSYDTIQ